MEEKVFRLGKEVHQVSWTRLDEHRREVRIDHGETHEVAAHTVENHRLLLTLSGTQCAVDFVRDGENLLLQVDGQMFHLKEEDRALAAGDTRGEDAENEIRAPMPGKVVRILVEPGQRITKATSLIILDSMKVEIELKAPRDAVVDAILVAEGEQLTMDQELITFQ